MKTIIKQLISCTITIFLTVVMLMGLSDLMERKYSVQKYNDFFQQEEDFDVLFLGSSHVIDGISPMDIWNDYGIVSYNLGGHSNTIPTSYWIMMCALEYTSPKVVVIDGYLLGSKYKISGDNYSSAHNSFDAFPLSKTKIQGIYDLMDDPVIKEEIENGTVVVGEERTPIGLLWNYSVYHSRWNELTEADFVVEYWYNKGAEDRVSIVPHDIPIDSTVSVVNSVGLEYLNKIIEECDKRGISVLLTYLPAQNGCQREANFLESYADERGIDYINFMNNDCINTYIDFSDEKGHLNPSGARKVSSYIAEYLMSNFDVQSRKEDERYKDWYKDYEEYVEYKNSLLKKQTDIRVYLMLLNDSTYECEIETTNEVYEEYFNLIDNISCLGKCTVNIVDSLPYYDFVHASPVAMVQVYHDGAMVDCIYCYNGGIYREP